MQEQKSMSDKLEEDFQKSVEQGNLGHAIGFYKPRIDLVHDNYLFVNQFADGKHTGAYTKRNLIHGPEGNFVWWNYREIQNEKKRIKILNFYD